ncbi:MAG: DUF6632 domain-containing protein [Gemmatimonadaceae bacterium]
MTTKPNPALRIALVLVGAMCLALGPLMLVWPAGWRWSPHHTHYEQMVVGIYFTLGIFLIRASKDPLQHRSIIWFAVWSSIVHASIMTIQALAGPEHRGHLVADVPALFLGAAALGFLMSRLPGPTPPLPVRST